MIYFLNGLVKKIEEKMDLTYLTETKFNDGVNWIFKILNIIETFMTKKYIVQKKYMSTFPEIWDILYELFHSFSHIAIYVLYELIISLDESGVLPEVAATRSTL